jgi:hypothetical protein
VALASNARGFAGCRNRHGAVWVELFDGFVPLRSSLDFFHDPYQPPALTRAKQAAILYDWVVVETGYILASGTKHSSQVWRVPPS